MPKNIEDIRARAGNENQELVSQKKSKAVIVQTHTQMRNVKHVNSAIEVNRTTHKYLKLSTCIMICRIGA